MSEGAAGPHAICTLELCVVAFAQHRNSSDNQGSHNIELRRPRPSYSDDNIDRF